MFREADRKMAGIQYSLEDRASLERKYKKQVNNCDNEASLIMMFETLAIMMVITIAIRNADKNYFFPLSLPCLLAFCTSIIQTKAECNKLHS